MATDNPRSWEVWLAYLHYADHPELGKVRPILVLGEGEPLVVAKITTAEPCGNRRFVEISDLEQAGLRKASRVQVEPLFSLSTGDVLRGPLGTLSPRDARAVNAALG